MINERLPCSCWLGKNSLGVLVDTGCCIDWPIKIKCVGSTNQYSINNKGYRRRQLNLTSVIQLGYEKLWSKIWESQEISGEFLRRFQVILEMSSLLIQYYHDSINYEITFKYDIVSATLIYQIKAIVLYLV